MPEPFELNGIEKGIHCVTRTGGCFNLDANLFMPEAVDLTSLVFRTPTAERLVLTRTALLWMATVIHGIPFYHILKLYFDLMQKKVYVEIHVIGLTPSNLIAKSEVLLLIISAVGL